MDTVRSVPGRQVFGGSQLLTETSVDSKCHCQCGCQDVLDRGVFRHRVIQARVKQAVQCGERQVHMVRR